MRREYPKILEKDPPTSLLLNQIFLSYLVYEKLKIPLSFKALKNKIDGETLSGKKIKT